MIKPLRWIVLLFLSLPLFGQQEAPLEKIHEAFITQIGGQLILDVIPTPPPPPIYESIPRPTEANMKWIPGYWAWDNQTQQYRWICGVWRNPPPGQSWVSGFWKQFDEGWVWIPGFWSSLGLSQLSFVENPPPDPIEEDVGYSPGINFFWTPGYWSYQAATQKYVWIRGAWQPFNKAWVLVPAHYTWRPEGYVFLPAHWDWPIDRLGQAYCIDPLFHPPAQFTPTAIEIDLFIEGGFYSYPYYTCWYWHHWHFNPVWWDRQCCVPPWWRWSQWWCFNSTNQWGLWWWWSHPGFPAPIWMNKEMAQKINPPPKHLIDQFSHRHPPKFITPQGVIQPSKLLNTAEKVTGKKTPFLPVNKPVMDEVIKKLPKPKELNEISPTGKGLPSQLPKPDIAPPIKADLSGKRISIPQAPTFQPSLEPPFQSPSIQEDLNEPTQPIRPLPPIKRKPLEQEPPPVLPPQNQYLPPVPSSETIKSWTQPDQNKQAPVKPPVRKSLNQPPVQQIPLPPPSQQQQQFFNPPPSIQLQQTPQMQNPPPKQQQQFFNPQQELQNPPPAQFQQTPQIQNQQNPPPMRGQPSHRNKNLQQNDQNEQANPN